MTEVAIPNGFDSHSDDKRFAHIDKILGRPGPSTDESFAPGEVKEFLRSTCKILVIGAGGLGCEILANLALSGFRDIHVIDMDTIDVSNLNRQFLFRQKDVGRPKATVAAEFVQNRVPGVKVTAYHGPIQDKDANYYLGFNIIICGLDSVPARRWINHMVVSLAQDADGPEGLKPLIDGGTEGFKGQARVILPTITSCYECSLELLTEQTQYPMCTLANTPRLPEHCIEWAKIVEWPRVWKDKKLDNDDPDHVQWLLEQAQARAKEHNIEGVTWSLTQGVIKNIIPAIASTNAIISAACTQEALKLATTCAPYLDNYMMYTGNESVFTSTFNYEKREDCPVCGGENRVFKVKKEWNLQKIIDLLLEETDFHITRPSLSLNGSALYYQAPPAMQEMTAPNLIKSLGELFENGDDLDVTDPNLPYQLTVTLEFED